MAKPWEELHTAISTEEEFQEAINYKGLTCARPDPAPPPRGFRPRHPRRHREHRGAAGPEAPDRYSSFLSCLLPMRSSAESALATWDYGIRPAGRPGSAPEPPLPAISETVGAPAVLQRHNKSKECIARTSMHFGARHGPREHRAPRESRVQLPGLTARRGGRHGGARRLVRPLHGGRTDDEEDFVGADRGAKVRYRAAPTPQRRSVARSAAQPRSRAAAASPADSPARVLPFPLRPPPVLCADLVPLLPRRSAALQLVVANSDAIESLAEYKNRSKVAPLYPPQPPTHALFGRSSCAHAKPLGAARVGVRRLLLTSAWAVPAPEPPGVCLCVGSRMMMPCRTSAHPRARLPCVRLVRGEGRGVSD
jgi:hypothetical protein